MYSLPDEQNKLLKEMGELDAQERAGLIPVRSNINLFLIFLVWFFGTVGVILNITGNRTDGIPLLIGICIGLSFFLILAYYNISFGFYLATIGFFRIKRLYDDKFRISEYSVIDIN